MLSLLFSHLSYVELHTLLASLLPSIHTPHKSSLGRLRKFRSAVAIFYSQNKLKLLTYLLPPWSRALLQKLTGLQLVKKFPTFYGTRKFITAFTTARHLPILSQSDPVHTSTSHFLKIHLNIILPSTSGSPQWSLSFRFPHQNPVHASPLPLMRYMPHPYHSIN